jgi:hypothetical protein
MTRVTGAIVAMLCLAAASARSTDTAVGIEQWHVHDFPFTAQAAGNPFDVELSGVFTGPGGVRLEVPGFYDGHDTWKIRFAPTRAGAWSLRTVANLPALNGRTVTAITATANTDPVVHGSLLIDPLHRHHFVYEDGTRYFLMGYEADWLGEADMLDPQRKVMHTLIDQMAARGFNHVLVNVYAHDTSWARGKQNQWDYGPPPIYVFGGTNDAPDHTTLNTEYFRIYDGMMEALHAKGIIANLYFKVYNKAVKWPAPGSRDEERYFRYVTARYQAFSNVVWDFSKEQNNERDKALEHRLIDLIRSTDAYHRLTTTHTMDGYFLDPALSDNIDFPTDQAHENWIAKVLFDRAVHDWPYLNSEIYYERGVDDLPTYPLEEDWQDQLRGAYEVYLSGGYFAYYYSNSAWDLVKPDPEPPGMARYQILKETLSALPYWVMAPHPELAVGGPCLAIPGSVYAVYVTPPERGGPRRPLDNGPGVGSDIKVNLTALPGAATLQWINTWSGERADARIDRPGVYQFNRPAAFGAAPAVLIVRSQS